VKGGGEGIALLALVSFGLNGCGSSTAVPYALTCKSHRLAGRFIRADVTVINSTGKTGNPIVFGPILDRVHHIYPPFLHPTHVEVTVSKATRIYVGFVVRGVRADKPSKVIFRLESPLPAPSILVSQSTRVRASDWSILDNPSCHIRAGI
jgi:hypothetical protein